ncbi:MAG: hypothetical protein HWD83_02265 [Gammaproteobacteria bacterium]|nr:hypothetical protein [Gammaproteobacteria bacterium]
MRLLSKICCCACVVLSSGVAFAQGQGQGGGPPEPTGDFTALLTIQSPVDFGEWDGIDITGGAIIPDANEGFCIIYQEQKNNTLHKVDYDLSLNGDASSGQYTITNGTSNLPIRFSLSKAGTNISTSGDAINPWTPGYVFSVTFENPATKKSELNSSTEFPNGCNDAKFLMDISIDGNDIVQLNDRLGTFTGTFWLSVTPNNFSGNSIKQDIIEFDVQVTVTSSVYITQLPPTLDLTTTNSTDFCIWSFAGDDTSLTIAGTETQSSGREFSMVNRDAGGAIVDTIGYNVRLDSLRDSQTVSTVSNGDVINNLPTVDANEYNCSGTDGLNYRLTFDVANHSTSRPGEYKDTLVLTATPM